VTAALPKSIRLRTLNALLASMVGTAPQLRSDVDAVLRVFEADDETDPRLNAADLAAAAAQIFRLLSPDRPVPTVAVLDHRAEPFDALWANERVEAALERWVPAESVPPQTIHRAMRYSLFAGGKRIRPVLCIGAAEALGSAPAGIEDAACTLEMIHTYSLIHDDLPALDNDDLRRGRPTNHVVFGEAMAILAGDSLLTLAFEVLGKLPQASDTTRARLVAELATASGTVGGMIGGQVHDIEGERQTPTAELLEAIHRAKTGALLRASVRMGAIYAGASPAQLDALSRYGEHIGLAFQIVDDILDVEESSETLGKTAGKDADSNKPTYVTILGLDAAKQLADQLHSSAIAALVPFGSKAQRLNELANFITQRSF